MAIDFTTAVNAYKQAAKAANTGGTPARPMPPSADGGLVLEHGQ